MEAINELEAAYEKAKKDPEFQKQLDYYLADFVGQTNTALSCRKLDTQTGRRKNLPKTRRPRTRRSTQNQQHSWPSVACETYG